MPEVVDDGHAPGQDSLRSDEPHAERISHYQKAADLAVTAHPLDGEDLNTPYIEDAQLWVTVYTELLAFKETLLRETALALKTISSQGYDEVTRTDAVLLAAEARRFRQRLAMWRQRCEELTSSSGEHGDS